MNTRRHFLKTTAGLLALGTAAGGIAETVEKNDETAAGYASGNFKVQNIKTLRSSGMDGTGKTLMDWKRPLRILAFGAHPDDCELRAGGLARLLANRGHQVKFVSVTNGDMGHWKTVGAPLAARRKAEVEAAAKILGNEVEVLDIGDGTLVPSLENRLTLVRLIREWKADVVIGHRPYDYQADHRYVGVLMQDTAFQAAVPGILPEIPAIPNPIYLYMYDTFQRPVPFHPDVVVAIDSVVDQKVAALDIMESQFYEGGCMAGPQTVPDDAAGQAKRHEEVRKYLYLRSQQPADLFRGAILARYGEEAGKRVKYAEAFEICEYGRKMSPEEVDFLFR